MSAPTEIIQHPERIPGASSIRCTLARDALMLALAEMQGAGSDYEVSLHESRAYGALSMALVLGGIDTDPQDWTNLIRRRATERRNVLRGIREHGWQYGIAKAG